MKPSKLFTDLENESLYPPDPAPDVPMRNQPMSTLKSTSNFILKIDKNGDQIHEEYIPSGQQGKEL